MFEENNPIICLTLLEEVNSEQLKKEPSSDEREAAGMTKPRGTFAGTIDLTVRTRDGRVVAADTGDPGGGQN